MESQQESRQHSALAFLFLLFSPYRISYTRYLCDSSHRLAGGFSPRSSLLTVARNLWPLSSAFSVSFFCSQPFSAPPHPSSVCLDRDSERLSLDLINHRHCIVLYLPCCPDSSPVVIVRPSDTLRGVHLSHYVVDAFIVLISDRDLNLSN